MTELWLKLSISIYISICLEVCEVFLFWSLPALVQNYLALQQLMLHSACLLLAV